jgi:hypothetical protein
LRAHDRFDSDYTRRYAGAGIVSIAGSGGAGLVGRASSLPCLQACGFPHLRTKMQNFMGFSFDTF